MSTIVNRAVETGKEAYAYVDPYVPQAAKDTATAAVNYATQTAQTAQTYATEKTTAIYEYGKVIVQGATTTIEAYTPGPVRDLIANTLEGAKHLREDPVGTVKPYVPSFVVQTGEKTYEIVKDANDKTREVAASTSGYIVTKVNGTVHSVTSIPQVAAVIEQLDQLTKGSLTKLGVVGPHGQPTEPAPVTPAAPAAPGGVSYAEAVKE
ncbi:hypothetical protein HDV00_001171 [Rhizophlyctis rosea]|nr:hypothetical protein HDV00_001171 [Rhizophlyctis rosea]